MYVAVVAVCQKIPCVCSRGHCLSEDRIFYFPIYGSMPTVIVYAYYLLPTCISTYVTRYNSITAGALVSFIT